MSNACVLSERRFLGAHVAVWVVLSNSRQAYAFSRRKLWLSKGIQQLIMPDFF